jgi:hypothetical protein
MARLCRHQDVVEDTVRGARELIAELEEESSKHWYVAIVIGFEDTTVFIQAKDPDRLQVLNDAIKLGGDPIGLIAGNKVASGLEVMSRVYPEHSDWEEEAQAYLNHLASEALHRYRLLDPGPPPPGP